MARQYDEAIVVCKKAANENPGFAMAHFYLAQAYWGKRMYAKVIEEWKAYGNLSGQRKTGYFSPYYIAELYADLGDKDKVFHWLNTAYQERDVFLQNLNTDFIIDPLRSNPRFAALVREVGLLR
jgi:tetratricopeptide (TPR) repeat protein